MPGMSPVACGECFSCGKVGHSSVVCTVDRRIPEVERIWHEKANSIRAGANTSSRNASTSVNLVAEDDIFVSREDYKTEVIARYLTCQKQGNGDGPSGN